MATRNQDEKKRLFILDTNVILYDYTCIYNFKEHDVVIPIVVLEEIDSFKKGSDLINFQAREFIRETRFERLGVFSYSKEDGTRAGAMAGQLSDAVKQRRREQAMAAQHKVAVAVAESFVGQTLKVLVESEASAKQLQAAHVSSWEHGLMREPDTALPQLKGRYLVARGEADAPDIDGRVYIRGRLPIGEFARVKIIGHTDYDLIAEPA